MRSTNSDGRKNMAVRRLSGVAALAVALGGGLTGAPEAAAIPGLPGEDKLSIGYKQLGSSCETRLDGMRRYTFRARMIVNNVPKYGRWANEMTYKIRLIPTTAGLNIDRGWKSQSAKNLLYNQSYTRDFTVKTSWVGGGEYRIEQRLVWDRPAPVRNVTRTFKAPVTALCRNIGGG
jgi:hypothetical protein